LEGICDSFVTNNFFRGGQSIEQVDRFSFMLLC